MTLNITVEVEAENNLGKIKIMLGALNITDQLDEDLIDELESQMAEEEFDSLNDPVDPQDWEDEVG